MRRECRRGGEDKGVKKENTEEAIKRIGSQGFYACSRGLLALTVIIELPEIRQRLINYYFTL